MFPDSPGVPPGPVLAVFGEEHYCLSQTQTCQTSDPKQVGEEVLFAVRHSSGKYGEERCCLGWLGTMCRWGDDLRQTTQTDDADTAHQICQGHLVFTPVHLVVGWFVNKITHKQPSGFPLNLCVRMQQGSGKSFGADLDKEGCFQYGTFFKIFLDFSEKNSSISMKQIRYIQRTTIYAWVRFGVDPNKYLDFVNFYFDLLGLGGVMHSLNVIVLISSKK